MLPACKAGVDSGQCAATQPDCQNLLHAPVIHRQLIVSPALAVRITQLVTSATLRKGADLKATS